MDERILRLKTANEARKLAKNAARLGDETIRLAALQRAIELQAIEEGYSSPAEQAIAEALIAYEEEMTVVRGKRFRANRTRDMLKRHGPLLAAERMVLTKRPSTGFTVLEEAGHAELSFESIVDRFPDEFSERAVLSARARLSGEPAPKGPSKRPTQPHVGDLDAALVEAQRLAIAEFDSSQNELSDWGKVGGIVTEGLSKTSGLARKSDDNPDPAYNARNISMRFGKRMTILEWMHPKRDLEARFYVIEEGGSAPSISVAGLPYEQSAPYAGGRLKVVAVFSRAEAEQAKARYLESLREYAPARTDSQKNVLAVSDYVEAFKSLGDEAAGMRWLTAHYYAPASTASMENLAETLGYSSFRVANSGYGAFAHKISDALPTRPDDPDQGRYSDWMGTLATIVDRNSEGHSQWRLRPFVIQALLELGWVEDQVSDTGQAEVEPSADDLRVARAYHLDETQVRQMMLSRRGHGRFRKDVMQFWGGECAVSGLRHPSFLVASHIKPWSLSNPNERLDGFNGLALTPNLDRAFDRGYITFDSKGRIRISGQLANDAISALGIDPGMKLRVCDSRIESYLHFHRENIFKP